MANKNANFLQVSTKYHRIPNNHTMLKIGNCILLCWMQWECISVILHACVYRVVKCDVTKNNIKFVKLWDLSRYSERTTSKMPTCQKLAYLWGKLFLRFYPSYALMTPSKCLGLNIYTQVKFRRICMESSPHNWANISETICPKMLIFGK